MVINEDQIQRQLETKVVNDCFYFLYAVNHQQYDFLSDRHSKTKDFILQKKTEVFCYHANCIEISSSKLDKMGIGQKTFIIFRNKSIDQRV